MGLVHEGSAEDVPWSGHAVGHVCVLGTPAMAPGDRFLGPHRRTREKVGWGGKGEGRGNRGWAEEVSSELSRAPGRGAQGGLCPWSVLTPHLYQDDVEKPQNTISTALYANSSFCQQQMEHF